MIAWGLALSLAIAPAASRAPADGLDVTLLPTSGETVAMLVTCRVRRHEDPSLTGQAQSALLLANQALPSERFGTELFAADARLTTSIGQHGADFLLVAPREEFLPLAQSFLGGLFKPAVDRAALAGLAGHVFPFMRATNREEELLVALEPILTPEAMTLSHSLDVKWAPISRIEGHVRDYFTPANTRVTVMGGFDAARVASMLKGFRGGTRKPEEKSRTQPNVRQTIPSPLNLHLFGIALTALSPSDAATVRVFRALAEERLTDILRKSGVTYSIEVSSWFSPAFEGLLFTLPVFDESGIDVEPFLAARISELTHGKVSQEELDRAKKSVQLADERARVEPADFLYRVQQSKADPGWLAPEHQSAVAGLNLDAYKVAVNRLLVDQNAHFYVKFMRLTGRTRP